jgi:pimeloyl-ACP methyl ester carboxylesterase
LCIPGFGRSGGRSGGSGFSLLGVDAPEARYIERDGAQLAYQVVGEGGVDVLVVGETAQHFDLCWTDPYIHELFERGASFSRTVYMQPRGFGLSERIRYVPTLEQHADDVLAVMDAVGMRAATLVGALTTSGLVALAAARAPKRVANLVLFKPIACGPLAPDAEQHGWSTGAAADYASRWRPALDRWGSGAVIDTYDPVQSTGYNRRLMAMLERCSATPATARQYWEWFVRLDISDVFRAVRSPTRVLYAPTSSEPEAVVRRVAELIPRPALPIYCWAIEHDGVVRLVDTSETAAARNVPFARMEVTLEQELPAAIAAAGLEVDDVSEVVLTHAHGDHMDGFVRLRGRALVHEKELEFLASPMARVMRRVLRQSLPPGFAPEPFTLDDGPLGTFARSHVFSDDGRIVAVETPGHTPGPSPGDLRR